MPTSIPGLGASFSADVTLDAYFKAGYDTFGIRKFLNTHNPRQAQGYNKEKGRETPRTAKPGLR